MITNRMMALLAGFVTLAACSKYPAGDPIDVVFPEPQEQLTKVILSEQQKGYARAGDQMALRLLSKMYDGNSFICSPLSLQCALAMTANGASGETLQEMVDFMGFGAEGIDAVNAYHKTLLEQLPAVDLDVDLKLTDALLVNETFPLQPQFQRTVQENYYAAVENDDFSDAEHVASRINDWASRSTNGFIDKILDAQELDPTAAAYIMNALYFKAKWAGSQYDPMFTKESTRDEDFTLTDGSVVKRPMMRTGGMYHYAEMDGYRVLALPYSNWKYMMFFLLPDDNNLDALAKKMATESWSDIQRSFSRDARVIIRLPRFDIENRFELTETLQDMGIRRAFKPDGSAEFDRMFTASEEGWWFWINKIWQKSRISVAEWGTEAASVTVVEMMTESAGPPSQEPKIVYFYADHPFLFILGETSSNTILFEGAYTGK